MAKTQWDDGVWLTPAFMTAFAGKSAVQGHAHDGADADGSVPKVVLTGGAQVQGQLPLTNMVDIPNTKLTDYTRGSFDVDVSSTYFNNPVSDKTMFFEKMGDRVTINIFSTGLSDTSGNGNQLQISPSSGTWPNEILCTGFDQDITVRVTKGDNSEVIGKIQMPVSSSQNWAVSVPNENSILTAFGFADNEERGLPSQSFTYLTGHI